ncbi:hypothetical protein ILYODFUR_016677 [Ilyodon furcidens]|uniref:Uncharacterized protein n=1 Tax=Ilyodon furcidens TaxID=33524 RepID=A0ABV0VEK0_9TELE
MLQLLGIIQSIISVLFTAQSSTTMSGRLAFMKPNIILPNHSELLVPSYLTVGIPVYCVICLVMAFHKEAALPTSILHPAIYMLHCPLLFMISDLELSFSAALSSHW